MRARALTQVFTEEERYHSGAAFGRGVEDLRSLSIRALKGMFRPERGLFVFRVRRSAGALIREGVSPRYTAIVLIGLAGETDETSADVLQGESRGTLWRRLAMEVGRGDNLGDIALTLWAGRLLGGDNELLGDLLRRLGELRPMNGEHPTVELAWLLMGLAADPEFCSANAALAGVVAERLLASFVSSSGMFRHMAVGVRWRSLRAHISCFADLVYPTQALARYYRWSGVREAWAAARHCAEQMCRLQGPAGQWWWHYDVRTGRVVERYPVYSVHQDAMAPMALLEVRDACGDDHGTAINRGLQWICAPTEIGSSLVDTAAGLIWRKVARREPAKLSRTAQALVSRLHPALRVPELGFVFPPAWVDYECRPYHLGWLLYAWRNRQSD